MMDGNSLKPVQSDSNLDLEDWITELRPDIQDRVGNVGMEGMKIQVASRNPNNNNLNQPDKVAANLEKKFNRDVETKSDFMSAISQKAMPAESLYHHGSAAASSNSGLAQTSRDSPGNSVGQVMQSSAFPNTQTELTRSQPPQLISQSHQPQQLLQQLMKQKVQQPHVQPSLMQSNIPYGPQKQQHHHILPAHFQSSPQSMFTTLQDQWQMGQLQNAPILQQKSQTGLQNNVFEKQQQLPLNQQSTSASNQQPLGLQSNDFGLPQQQQKVGPQSDFLKMQTHQHPSHILQQSEVTAPQQKFQQTLKPMQFPQIMGTHKPSNSLQEGMQQRLQTSATLLHPQSVMVGDQPKPLEQSKRLFPEASSASVDSTTQTQHAYLADWHDQAYQQIQSMRETHLAEVIKLYKRAHELCLQPPNSESATKNEKTRIFVERIIKFLQMPRADMIHLSKEKVHHYLKVITWYLNSRNKNSAASQYHEQLQPPGMQSKTPQLQQHSNMKPQFNSLNQGLTFNHVGSPQFSTQQGVPNSQANMINSLQDGCLSGSETLNAQRPLQYSSGRSTQNYTLCRPQQNNMMTSLNNGSQIGLEQRTLSPLWHGLVKTVHQNTLSMRQQTNSSPRTSVNASDPTMNSLLPSCTSLPSHHVNQQPKHQMLQMEKMKQPMQQPNKQQMLMQKIHELNDSKVGQVTCSSSRKLRQYHSVGQLADYSFQSPLPSTLCQLHAASPQTSQHFSPQVDTRNLLSPLSKAGTPLQSSTSPYILPSPSTPLTPSSIPVDSEKHSSGISPLSMAENPEHPKTPVAPAQIQSLETMQNQILAIGTPGTSTSPFLTEFTCLENSQQPHAMGQPHKRLLEVVKSISSKAFSASLLDIGSVINMTDRFSAPISCARSRYYFGPDLVDDLRYLLQESNLSLQYESGAAEKMERHISAMTLDALSSPFTENDSFEWMSGQASDTASTATSRIKRPRIEPNNDLLDEMKEINQKLVETTLDVVLDSPEDATRSGSVEGTIVSCSYIALSFTEIFGLQYGSSRMLPNLVVQLLVPANYPNSSPIILETLPDGWSEKGDGLTEKVKIMFITSLRKLSQPMSLGDMARTWDVCARAVLSEFAERKGGKCFSSRYGTWDNCITAP